MKVTETRIRGLFTIELDVYPDERGSFREAWQREKMVALGLPDFTPVQANVSESKRGALRGIHAEPWDKYIHLAYGTGFAAIVDLREGEPTFGTHLAFELNQKNALFVSKGLANSFQALSEFTVYSYLVTGHWQASQPYVGVAYDDPDLGVAWPITGAAQILSQKDRKNPRMRELFPNWQP